MHSLLQSCPSAARFVPMEGKIRVSRAEEGKEVVSSNNSFLFLMRKPSGNFTCIGFSAFHAVQDKYMDKKVSRDTRISYGGGGGMS